MAWVEPTKGGQGSCPWLDRGQRSGPTSNCIHSAKLNRVEWENNLFPHPPSLLSFFILFFPFLFYLSVRISSSKPDFQAIGKMCRSMLKNGACEI